MTEIVAEPWGDAGAQTPWKVCVKFVGGGALFRFWADNLNVVKHSDWRHRGAIPAGFGAASEGPVPSDGESRRFPPRHPFRELPQVRQKQLRLCSQGSSGARTAVSLERQHRRQDPRPEPTFRPGTGKSGEGGGTIPRLPPAVPRTGRSQPSDLSVASG